ncbi:uncharacterized protein LOC121370402 [Gigantopelta aegis]|uniref:uncharacterized protein LOC121370402 n=1 Tax=Gigantopelta aegis TaxID=1735272 RepID=UPI001B88814F|nr:uncharacterized protein LOC121370402 [Gigantopelta aegis]
MEAIEAYNSDSDDDIGEETSLAVDGIKIVEGSSVSLKPTDFFGFGNSEDCDEPPRKKTKADDEEKNTVVMVQGSVVEILNTDFWRDITHKQIVFINNSKTTSGNNMMVMTPGQTFVSKSSSDTSLITTSNMTTKLVTDVKKSVTESLATCTTANKNACSNSAVTSYAVPLAKPVQLVSMIQPSSGSLPILNIVPSTQTNVPLHFNTTAVQAVNSPQTVFNLAPSSQSVQNVLLDNSAQVVQNLATNRVKPLGSSEAIVSVTPPSQTKQICTTGTSPTTSTLRSILSTPALSSVTQARNILQTSILPSSLHNDGSLKTPVVQTFLLPAKGDQPAKLIQLFPAKSVVGQNLLAQNVSAVLPTSIPQVVQNAVVVGNPNQHNQVQIAPSLVPLIQLMPGTQQTLTVPVTQQTLTVPVTQQTLTVPGTQQTLTVPVTQQSLTLPVTQQTLTVPVTQQTLTVPVTQQTLTVPVTQQTFTVPVTQQTLTVPVTQQTLTVPVTLHSPQLTQVVRSEPQNQIPAAQKLQSLASQISENKMKTPTQNKSELLRLLRSPLVTSPVSLQTSALAPKSSETNAARVPVTVTLTPVSDSTPTPPVSENGLERACPGIIIERPLSERVDNLLCGHYVTLKKDLFRLPDKLTCLFNKALMKKKPPTRLERSFIAHRAMVTRIKWNYPQYSHLFLSASMDGTIKVFNGVDNADFKMLLQVYSKHSKAVKDAEWSYDGKSILSCSYDQTALVIDVETGNILRKLQHDSFVTCGKFHPVLDKNVVTGSKNLLQAWDIRTPEKPVRVFNYKDKMGQIQDILFCQDGQQLFSASGIVSRDSADRNIMAWDYSTGAILSNQIFQERFSCTRLKLHPNKDLFLSQTQGGYIAIFSSKRPYEMVWSKRYEGHKMEGYDIGFDISSDGSVVVSGSADGILHCYSNFTGKLWRTMKTGFDVCLDAAVHPILPSTVACCSTKGQIKLFH